MIGRLPAYDLLPAGRRTTGVHSGFVDLNTSFGRMRTGCRRREIPGYFRVCVCVCVRIYKCSL